MRTFYRTDLTDKIMMLTGTFLTALAYTCFFIPWGIAPGGIGGLSVIVSGYVPLKAGLLTVMFNIPVFIFADRMLGRDFVFRTFFLLVIMSALMDVLPLSGMANNRLISAISGGLLMGAGLGTVLFTGASTGGTDTLALSLQRKYPSSSPGRILLLLDLGVVLLSAVCSGVENALCSAAAVFVEITVIEVIQKIYSRRMISIT